MRLFWKKLNFGKNKIEILSVLGELGLNIHIWAHWPEIKKKKHKFSSLNLLMLTETILEMPYCPLNFGKKQIGNFTLFRGTRA